MKTHQIHAILRNRLFDFTKRNRLLYFKTSLRHVSLTLSSVPVIADASNIDLSKLFVWNEDLSKKISAEQDIHLSKYISFQEKPYIVASLNKIRQQANKDEQEYGFHQLRLALCFLEWYDTKNNHPEKIVSPLLLLPVQLTRKKGITDDFILKISDSEAEINPVLAGRLKDLYNIILPETIDLTTSDLSDVFQLLKKQVEESSQLQLAVSHPDVLGLQTQAISLHQKYNKSGVRNIEIDIDSGPISSDKNWKFDLTNMVLGNFNYRKMSLVRDYDSLMEAPKENEVFAQLFDDVPTKPDVLTENLPLSEQFQVIQADPTQLAAIRNARNGKSYIIQGPPGTGKSQTIVNLIADFIARGKRVLFVCEKRAAIDVVYSRLKQQHLHELCSLIHDSQTDKKVFVMDLKKTAESFEKRGVRTSDIEHNRNQIIYQIERELYAIRLYHSFMQQRLEKIGMDVRKLLDIVLSTRKHIVDMDLQTAPIPGYEQWVKYGNAVHKISDAIQRTGDYQFFSEHPLSRLDEASYFLYDRSNILQNELSSAHALLAKISTDISQTDIPADIATSFFQLKKFMDEVGRLFPFHDAHKLTLLEKDSELATKFEQAITHIRQLENALSEQISKNAYWKEKFSDTDLDNAWQVMQEYERKFFSFLSGKYRRTKKAIVRAYDFSRHQIRPTYSQVLSNLQHEYVLSKTFLKEKSDAENVYGLGDLFELENTLKAIFNDIKPSSVQFLKQTENASALKKIVSLFEEADKKITSKIKWKGAETLQQVYDILGQIIKKLQDLPEILPYLKELSMAESSLKNMLVNKRYRPEQIEALSAQNTLQRFFDLNPELYKISGHNILYNIEKLKDLYAQFLQVNASYIRCKQRDRYRDLVKRSEMSIAGKSESEKEEKKTLAEGRKILQNEFGKAMRYKSIRDLSSLESGNIIRELKPVWLMSPLSVSDTLPLSMGDFDVVVFDEASQITLEEGIPSIYRAPQTIIVGDEMQMPPSHFFSTAADGDMEDKPHLLDADSFLQQGSRKFPSVMLGWHYRSKHESLIGFSNSAFYENRLFTIPDSHNQHHEKLPITVERKEDAAIHVSAMMHRPISYHFLKHGLYEQRTNVPESEYIAEMVRALLQNEERLSIGVVAFSQEQQSEIEDAIQELCAVDSAFEQALEEEYKRMESGQFMGIFFKNLENVQGDERDIIIISTCYGYDKQGKMLMNFGPINRAGGEKRLNVIFSRAKNHVCVVSSIKHTDITNVHNTGANYFKKYLQYAEAVSLGNMATANTVLESLNITSDKDEKNVDSVVLYEVKTALEKYGYVVEMNLGQSSFKCHIAIKKTLGDISFIAGILLDDFQHYQGNDLLEIYLFKPQLLKNNGWNIIQLFSKDWYTDSEKVLEQIIHAIENNQPAAVTDFTSVISNEPFPVQDIQHQIIRLETNENGNPRFWEVKREGVNLIIRYGKMQATGKKNIKPFSNEFTAEKEMQKMIQEKIKKGYTLK